MRNDYLKNEGGYASQNREDVVNLYYVTRRKIIVYRKLK